MIGQKKRKGFTLIELMVVITIIAIIAGVAIVAINGALFTARQKACSVNMTNLYKALTNYALTYSGSFPVSKDFADSNNMEAMPTDPAFGANCLFYLFQEGNVEAKQFICPAQTHRANGIKKIPLGTEYLTAKTSCMFDNNIGGDKYCDYAFDPRHRQDESTPGVVIIADRPPKAPGATAAQPAAGSSNALEAKNSANHSKKGQNCLLISGSVEWFQTTACGVNKDEIYELVPNSAEDSCVVP